MEMNEIIRELATTYPKATPEEISITLLHELQRAIPEAIQRLRMPKPPSAATTRLLKLRLQRMKSFRRSAAKKKQSSHERLITELYQVRYRLNGHGLSGTSAPAVRDWTPNTFTIPELLKPDGQPSLPETVPPVKVPDLDAKRTPVPAKPNPYSLGRWETSVTRVKKFVYDESSVLGLETQPLYLRTAMSMEEASREFAERSSTDWEFKFAAESDIEVPTWNKWVLYVSCPVTDFEEKVRLWNELDRSVRDRIMMIAKARPELTDEIRRFSKSFFLRMDLN